ncbi:MAG: hypothetical protein ACRD0P_20325 [Stackebrandtia sp.]
MATTPKQLWRTKGLIDDAEEEGKSYAPATAITVLMHNTNALPDDIEVLKADVAATRTEIGKLREELASDLAPELVEALAKQLEDGLPSEAIVAAVKQAVQELLAGLANGAPQPRESLAADNLAAPRRR